jgi:ATP-binding cassette subfamily A (ABC1) protein 3
MFIYLIPFYYLTSRIAAEKESKAREGMKMMGLEDGTYFISWLVLFFCISFIASGFVTLISMTVIFKNVNVFMFFGFCMLYSLTLYGWSFCIVAFLSTQRTSSIAATLFHIISYFLTAILQDPKTSSSLQYGMSVLPNVCMT